VRYRLNRLDEPVFMARPKLILTEFGIHYRLESCVVDRHTKHISFDLHSKRHTTI